MKLLSLTITKVDSTSFYRANGVFGDLQRRMPDLHITSMDVKDLRNMGWPDLKLFDIVFMQRPYSGLNLQMARFVKDMRMPLWIDFDDNLFEIPRGNRAKDTFMNPATRKNIEETARLADVISVSTGALAEIYTQLNKNVVVIPNALDTKNLLPRPKKQTEAVLWRGSDTHNLDLYLYAEEIYSIHETYTTNEFLYLGYDPWFIPPTPNFKYAKATDPILYFQQISKIAPKIMHVPLVDSHFNRCKSDIAYLEGTYAGAVCLVPDWPEWQHPGTVRYNSVEEYAEKLRQLLNGGTSFNKYNRQAWEYIMQNRTLEVVNQQRVDLLNQLIKQNNEIDMYLINNR